MNLDRLKASIALHEGFKGKPYLDPKGKVTIGFGRNLEDNPLTEEEGWYLSQGIITQSAYEARFLVHNWDTLGDARQNVLIELVYNIGLYSALGFHAMRAALDNGAPAEAALELLNSKWKNDVGPDRAGRMAEQLKTGEFA